MMNMEEVLAGLERMLKESEEWGEQAHASGVRDAIDYIRSHM